MKIAVITGSKSDLPVVDAAKPYLEFFDLEADIQVLSAHRNPEKLKSFINDFETNGGELFIGVAGMAAHLPGVIASHTTLPVLGVPVKGPNLDGLDALLSIVQMPKGVPVATFTIGKAGVINAIIFAAQILAPRFPRLREKLIEFKRSGSKL